MKMEGIHAKSETLGIVNTGKMKKPELIHSIQEMKAKWQ